jgi:hypothetical protein
MTSSVRASNFFDLLSQHFYEINASVWVNLRARFVIPKGIRKQFPPSLKKAKANDWGAEVQIDVPNEGMRGNVHDRHVVDVPSGSFEKATQRAAIAAKNVADLESGSVSQSASGEDEEDVLHTRNAKIEERSWSIDRNYLREH